MSDFDGQESTTETPEAPAAPEVQAPEDHSTESQPEANPFWGEVEKLTGPNVYKLIQPHLAKADTAARERIEALNQKLSPWSEFETQGIQPQHVKQALGVVQQLNTQPEVVFESLRTFLEREGRMPNKAELKKEVVENEETPEGESEDPRDKQLAELRQQQEAMQQFLQDRQMQEQQAAAAQEADTWLNGEVTRLQSSGKGYDKEDLQEIVRIAAFQAQQSGQDPQNLDAAAAQFDAMRDRIRTTPRPGESAPRLPMGPGGGSPQQAVDTSSMSAQQRRELVANMLTRQQQ